MKPLKQSLMGSEESLEGICSLTNARTYPNQKNPTDEQHDGEVHIVQGGTMPGNFKGKTFFSWTLVPDIFYGLKKDWGSLFYTDWIKRSVGQRGYVVFAAADVSSNDFL